MCAGRMNGKSFNQFLRAEFLAIESKFLFFFSSAADFEHYLNNMCLMFKLFSIYKKKYKNINNVY